MSTTVMRRIVLLAALAVVAALVAKWRVKATTPLPAAPQWPPLESVPAPAADDAPVTADDGPVTADDGPVTAPAWVAPAADGSCPAGYPVKVKESSGIYHVPEGSFYARTRPDRCYADAETAEADGYRRAKS